MKTIPKIIHLVWFGKKPYPPLAQRCIESWQRNLPEYKIMVWNEDSFDLGCCEYVRQAHAQGKWAFVSDYVRLWALYKYGGIYLDTDVELCGPLDHFLQNEAFAAFEG